MRIIAILLITLALTSAVLGYRKYRKARTPRDIYETSEMREHFGHQNSKSEENRSQFPQGHSKYEEALSFPLWVRILDVVNVEQRPFSLRNVKLNQIGTLFIAEQENDITQVTNSVSLREVVSEDERLDQGRCCEAIQPIFNGRIGSEIDEENPSNYQCFTLDANQQIWTFCSEDGSEIYEFRHILRMHIIENFFDEHSLHQPDFLRDNNELPTSQPWSFLAQEEWPAACSGKYQSPIAFESTSAVQVQNQDLQLNYRPSSYNVRFNGHENQVYGDFGQLTHLSERGEVVFDAYKLVFKFPAEHIIDENEYPAELQIHHQSVDGVEAIVSVLLSTADSSIEESEFFQSLQPELWETIEKWSIALDGGNLDALVPKKTLSQTLNRSFYHYKGSISTPPCTEGVEHFILKEAVPANGRILGTLQYRTFDVTEGTNARHPQTFNDVVYFSEDVSSHCEPGIPDSIKDLLEDSLEEQKDQISNLQQNNKTEYPGKFVKATAVVDDIEYLVGNTTSKTNGIEIDVHKLPDSLKRRLHSAHSVSGVFNLDEKAAPAEGKNAANTENAAPAEGDAAPAEGDAAPAEGDAAPAEGDAAPAETDAPAETEAAPAEGENAAEEEESAPTETRRLIRKLNRRRRMFRHRK